MPGVLSATLVHGTELLPTEPACCWYQVADPQTPPPQGKGKWVFARFLPEDPLQPTFSETPRCPLIQFPVPGTFPSQQLSQKSLKQKFLLDFLPDHSLPLRRGPCLLWHSLPARPCGAFNRLV